MSEATKQSSKTASNETSKRYVCIKAKGESVSSFGGPGGGRHSFQIAAKGPARTKSSPSALLRSVCTRVDALEIFVLPGLAPLFRCFVQTSFFANKFSPSSVSHRTHAAIVTLCRGGQHNLALDLHHIWLCFLATTFSCVGS